MSAVPEPIGLPASSRRHARRDRLVARPTTWLAALVFLTLLVAALAPWTLSRDALREEVAAQLRSSAGLYVFPRGAVRLSILPRPRINFDDVAFVDPNGALVVEAPAMTGDVRLLPLLAGRLEVVGVALKAPRITVDLDRAPMSSAGAAVRAAAALPGSPQAAKTDAARLGIVSIADGSAQLRRNGVAAGTLTHIDARLDWRSVAAPAALTGSFGWAGQTEQITLWISTPAALLRGGASPLTFEVRTPDTSLISVGSATATGRPRFEGHVRLNTHAMPSLLALAGFDLPLPPALKEGSLESDLVATSGAGTLGNLRLDVGTGPFEGALAWQSDGGRPTLTGTLATTNLALAPFVDLLPSTVVNAADHDAKGIDLDLRISANRMRYERLQADDAALSITSHAGRFEVTLAEAAAYGGQVKARAILTPADATGRSVPVQTSLALRGVDWGAIDRDFVGQGRLSGMADLSLSLQGAIDAAQPLAANLDGEGKLSLTRGEIGGLDLAGALARLDTRPLAAASDLASGRTGFDRAVVPFSVEHGTARISRGEITGADYALSLAGTLQIADGQMAMTAAVRPSTGAREGAGFDFEISGPWRRPQITPDVRSLIRRSGAASPLFTRPAALGDSPR